MQPLHQCVIIFFTLFTVFPSHAANSDQLRAQLGSDDQAEVTSALKLIVSQKNKGNYPDIFRMFMEADSSSHDDMMGLLSQGVSGMGSEAIPFIEDAYKKNTYPERKPRLAWLLGHLITRYELTIINDPRVTKILESMMFDEKEQWSTRLRAAGSLGRGGNTSGFEIAMRGLTEPTNQFAKMVAGWALGFIGLEEGIDAAIPILLKGLESETASVLNEGIHGLGNIAVHASDCQKFMIATKIGHHLDSENQTTQINAVVALGKMEWDDAREPIEVILRDAKSEELRMRAAQSLSMIKSEASVERLKVSTKSDEAARVRQWSLIALGKIDQDIRAFLPKYIENESSALNISIAKGILERQNRQFN